MKSKYVYRFKKLDQMIFNKKSNLPLKANIKVKMPKYVIVNINFILALIYLNFSGRYEENKSCYLIHSLILYTWIFVWLVIRLDHFNLKATFFITFRIRHLIHFNKELLSSLCFPQINTNKIKKEMLSEVRFTKVETLLS